MKIWTLAMTALLMAAGADADAARRLGGGQSVGKQSPNVGQREGAAAPAQPAPAAQVAQKSPSPAAPAAAPAAQPQRSRLGGMVAGLAAGLGLAWLAHTLGFGEAFAGVLLFALLGLAAAMAVTWFVRSRRTAPPGGGAYAWQSAGPAPATTSTPRSYNPEKIGNDASARPWERSSMAFDAAKYAGGGGHVGPVTVASSGGWGIPAGFDAQGFVDTARRNFVTLQAAWDRGDTAVLRAMMTDEMSAEIGRQLAARGRPAQPVQPTEVVMLEAKLLGIEDQADAYMASVEFSGMTREEAGAGPSPFREVWNMTKPKGGESGWLVAGVQALQ